MALTLAELITRGESNTGRSEKTDAEWTAWFNDALKAMARKYPGWKDLQVEYSFTLDTDEYRYAFPSDMMVCHGIRVIDSTRSWPLVERTKRWLNHYEANPDSAAARKPYYYCVDGNYFDLPAKPDDTYECYINYTKWPTELSADVTTATANIDQIDDALIAYACAECFRSLSQFENADRWEAVSLRRYRDARIADNARPNFTPRPDGVIRGAGGRRSSEPWNDPEVG